LLLICEFHLVKHVQANAYLPPTVQRLTIRRFVIPVE